MEESYNIMNILSIEEAKQFLPVGRDEKKVIIITGVTGQDGSFMADYLLKNTKHVLFGGARRLSVYNHENLDHLKNAERFHLINFDLTDAHSISQIVSQLKPDYFINFAAQSFVKSSWDFPAQTWETNTTGVLNILEAIRLHCPTCRFYNAGSSEEFGDIIVTPQNETHPLRPRSPYGASKAAARQLVKVYRESYNLYAVQGWLFNHEGTRRGEEFVTRKITKGVARIAKSDKSKIEPLELGNLDVKRDWSDAEDCVDAVWRMLNQEVYNENIPPAYTFTKYMSNANGYLKEEIIPRIKEYVVASGESHTVREFVEKAFAAVGIYGHWVGFGQDDTFRLYERNNNYLEHQPILVRINPAFYRPAEVETLQGNPERIKNELKWNPQTSFDQLVRKMVERDLED